MYEWAANKTKLQVAISKLKSKLAENGKELNEENIKEQYILQGGLVLDQPKKVGRPANPNVNKTPVKTIQVPKASVPVKSVNS